MLNSGGHYRYIIFDLDGTLSDPREGICKGFRYALGKMNVKIPDESFFSSLIGPPLQNSMREHFFRDEKKVWEAIAYFREYYSTAGLFENVLYEGIGELLQGLKLQDKKLFVATNKPQPFAERILGHFGIASHFDSIHGVDLMKAMVSKEELLEKILATIDADERKKAVIIGDTQYDIAAGKNCGIDTIAITYGFGTVETIREAGPDHTIASVEKLHQFLLS